MLRCKAGWARGSLLTKPLSSLQPSSSCVRSVSGTTLTPSSCGPANQATSCRGSPVVVDHGAISSQAHLRRFCNRGGDLAYADRRSRPRPGRYLERFPPRRPSSRESRTIPQAALWKKPSRNSATPSQAHPTRSDISTALVSTTDGARRR